MARVVLALTGSDSRVLVQCVSNISHRGLEQLLSAWSQATGTPLLINRPMAEPFVKTPQQAIDLVQINGLDALSARAILDSQEASVVIDCAIICPAYFCRPSQLGPFSQMVESLLAQTDDSWLLILIDDGSPLPEAEAAFAYVKAELGEKVRVIRRERNSGQGLCRNLGARWAWRASIPYCIYLDSDDQADVNRVKTVRQTFRENAGADFMYSSFRLIDEAGDPVPDELITPSIKEILDSHKYGPPVGKDVWREIGVIRGYTTLTSTVSVRTWLAGTHPFPDVYVSEDQHTWLRMTATTNGVVFDNSTMSSYRVTTDGSGSSVRKRVGTGYYEQKAWVDTAGFIAAMRIALRLGKLELTEVPELLSAFFMPAVPRRCKVRTDCRRRRNTTNCNGESSISDQTSLLPAFRHDPVSLCQ